MRGSIVCVAAFLFAALCPSAVHAQQDKPANVLVQNGQVVMTGPGTSRVLQVGCSARAAVTVESLLAVACDDGMLRTFMVSADGTLMPLMSRQVGPDVRGLFVKDRRVWVEFEHAAQPLDSVSAPTPPPPPPPPPPQAQARPV